MLPTPTDNGARLAAILPTAIASMAISAGSDPSQVLYSADALPDSTRSLTTELLQSGKVPPARSVLIVVVDGLGHANLKAKAGHARSLSSLPNRRIETVIPSTTSAALTTITTGVLPGEHGLIGYKIRHPRLGLLSPLKDWAGVVESDHWQRCEPLFSLTASFGARSVVIGRPAHASGGLTEAILRGADYRGGQTIADRFSIASQILREESPTLCYLYVDELDKAAHSEGWQSDKWQLRLEQLDSAFDDLLRTLPGDIGVMVTADHGMIDVDEAKRIMLDASLLPDGAVAEIGGEPRMRSLYLNQGFNATEVAAAVQASLGKTAWVGTREEAIAANWFGPVAEGVADRLGDVLVAARAQFAFTLPSDDPGALLMIGQHGGVSDEERGVPLIVGGSFVGTGIVSAITELANLRSS
ncbi:alkaline phosphatase family protein [Leucobacter sp. UT-8R-CII-1-4]|uniref:alkaline phosphatase family protein n=1 Tax=Leucobacter sp. UT-8R-CII-1-4 TaxID=3040075 RepID=UPI0024A87996|nr:nucleotide pyrophosphatase/phosphodiesterase family protein [Leucobacter sp. UT-8R-CII-1-4]MDI6024306.1 alkaline phosphatase family protein [Leucobacter sp. UT-8R-CII-1-4]